jgi:hypothetical protein
MQQAGNRADGGALPRAVGADQVTISPFSTAGQAPSARGYCQ